MGTLSSARPTILHLHSSRWCGDGSNVTPGAMGAPRHPDSLIAGSAYGPPNIATCHSTHGSLCGPPRHHSYREVGGGATPPRPERGSPSRGARAAPPGPSRRAAPAGVAPPMAHPRLRRTQTDFVFQRIFGSETTDGPAGFLNNILARREPPHHVRHAPPPRAGPKVSELKKSIVDVKCVDAAGTTYVVEMQSSMASKRSRSGSCTTSPKPTQPARVGFAYPDWTSDRHQSATSSVARTSRRPRPELSRWRCRSRKAGSGAASPPVRVPGVAQVRGSHDPKTCGKVGVLLPGGGT